MDIVTAVISLECDLDEWQDSTQLILFSEPFPDDYLQGSQTPGTSGPTSKIPVMTNWNHHSQTELGIPNQYAAVVPRCRPQYYPQQWGGKSSIFF